MSDKFLSKCVNCETKLSPGAKFCYECGKQITRSDQTAKYLLGEKLLLAGDKPSARNRTIRTMLLIICSVLVPLLTLIVFMSFESSTKEVLVESVPASQSQAPISPDQGISPVGDQSASSMQTQYVSEWKIFSDSEAVKFWSDQLGSRFTQEDVFVKLLFPSLSDEVKIYSIPYIQLLIWPTTEWFEQEEKALNQDIYQAGDRSTWVACSNVVIVFPNSRYNEIAGINDVFCD